MHIITARQAQYVHCEVAFSAIMYLHPAKANPELVSNSPLPETGLRFELRDFRSS